MQRKGDDSTGRSLVYFFYLFIYTTIILCVSVGHIEICKSLAPVKIGSVSFKSVLHFSYFIKFIW